MYTYNVLSIKYLITIHTYIYQLSIMYSQMKMSHSIHMLSIKINTKNLPFKIHVGSITWNCPSLQPMWMEALYSASFTDVVWFLVTWMFLGWVKWCELCIFELGKGNFVMMGAWMRRWDCYSTKRNLKFSAPFDIFGTLILVFGTFDIWGISNYF